MKKLILLAIFITTTLLMTITVYATTGDPFVYRIMEKNGTVYSNTQGVGNITLPDDVYRFYVSDDYIYYTKLNQKYTGYIFNLYRSNKDLTNETLLTTCDQDNIFYYNNSIYYSVHYSEQEILYSINLSTNEIKKHLTYFGDIVILNVENDYIYFTVMDKTYTTTKLYKQSITDRTDKRLLYLTRNSSIYECVIAKDILYVDVGTTIKLIDKNTDKLLGEGKLEDEDVSYILLGQIDNTVYLSTDTGDIMTISSKGEINLVATNKYMDSENSMSGDYILNGKIFLYSGSYYSNDIIFYAYDNISKNFKQLNYKTQRNTI